MNPRNFRAPLQALFPGVDASGLFATITGLLALLALARSLLPSSAIRSARRLLARVALFFDPYLRVAVNEFTSGSTPDQNYKAVKLYLAELPLNDARRLVVVHPKNAAEPVFSLGAGETTTDTYSGALMSWTHHATTRAVSPAMAFMGAGGGGGGGEGAGADEVRSFELCLHRDHRRLLQPYLRYIREQAEEIEKRTRELQVYSNAGMMSSMTRHSRRMWDPQPFKHPATFETLALTKALKASVLTRLAEFKGGAEYYRRTGRAHKMGILLYGPPGTGKTSFIAALANHMRYSIYDLDLTGVSSNLDLRALLAQISDQAIIVIEDIDTVEMLSRAAVAAPQQPEAPPPGPPGPPGGGWGGRRHGRPGHGMQPMASATRPWAGNANAVPAGTPAFLQGGSEAAGDGEGGAAAADSGTAPQGIERAVDGPLKVQGDGGRAGAGLGAEGAAEVRQAGLDAGALPSVGGKGLGLLPDGAVAETPGGAAGGEQLQRPPPPQMPQQPTAAGAAGNTAAGASAHAHVMEAMGLGMRSQLTLGGVLNFADGLRSCGGHERIFVFTTNHPERLDPALLRPGRMDMHIELSYCTPEVFKALCRTYLGAASTEHPLMHKIEASDWPSARLTPADAASLLDTYRSDAGAALASVLDKLQERSYGGARGVAHSQGQ